VLAPNWFLQQLQKRKISFFTGVPDSLLKEFCACLTDTVSAQNHIIAANEGNAIALAAGYHLATCKTGMVYMQNSGLGNSVNPLTSLVDPAVYGIPVLLLIGWRGEPGVKDEPQHIVQGAVTLAQLDILNIPYRVLPTNEPSAEECLDMALQTLQQGKQPFALVARKGSFSKYDRPKKEASASTFSLSREDAIRQIAASLQESDIVVSTTGKTSRELFEYRASTNSTDLGQDFLTVGSMGHAAQIALGIALQKPDRQVFCLDGDGALIMHMGGLAIIGNQSVGNFKHIVLNNGTHDSVGGQPTVAFQLDIPAIAQACGYHEARQVRSAEELSEALARLRAEAGPSLIEVQVRTGARSDLGRPTTTPQENKRQFMQHLQQ
jgi:phosphonopyruvate decarboxylase